MAVKGFIGLGPECQNFDKSETRVDTQEGQIL
jgi:hypothetical protein